MSPPSATLAIPAQPDVELCPRDAEEAARLGDIPLNLLVAFDHAEASSDLAVLVLGRRAVSHPGPPLVVGYLGYPKCPGFRLTATTPGDRTSTNSPKHG